MIPESLWGIADPLSSALHLLGAVAALLLTGALAKRAAAVPGQAVFLRIFALSAAFLLTASGVYHCVPRATEVRDVLQRLDHASIFILIAGTFTAGHGLFFRGFWRWGAIALVWLIGFSGSVAKLVFFEEISEGVGLTLYLSMGWLGLATMIKLALRGSWREAGAFCLGGGVYTLGAVGEYLGGEALTLIPGAVGPHELFHLSVLGGLAAHWRLFHVTAGRPVAKV